MFAFPVTLLHLLQNLSKQRPWKCLEQWKDLLVIRWIVFCPGLARLSQLTRLKVKPISYLPTSFLILCQTLFTWRDLLQIAVFYLNLKCMKLRKINVLAVCNCILLLLLAFICDCFIHRYLHNLLCKNQQVTEQNRSLLVETVRSISEILIWGDQNDSSVFEYVKEFVSS